MVTIRTFSDSVSAHIAKGLLEENGIECFLADENISSLYPMATVPFGGIRLQVSEENAELAAEILEG